MKLTKEWNLLKSAYQGWSDDKAMTSSAALAYYALFSIAPLLMISLAVAGAIFGAEASRGHIFASMQGLVGAGGAEAIESMVKSASEQKSSGIIATVLGLLTLILGSSSVFAQLQDSLNGIWKVQAKPGRSLFTLLRQRLLSFSMVVVIAFLLLVSLVLGAALSAMGKFMGESLPGGEGLWHGVNFGFSFGVITLLFASIYKILPDVYLRWRDVWKGAAGTALFFTIGKFLIGLYLGHSSVASSYGAAGSAVILLLWSFYSSAILFFGAEFTRAVATENGRLVEPKDGAETLAEAEARHKPLQVTAPSSQDTQARRTG